MRWVHRIAVAAAGLDRGRRWPVGAAYAGDRQVSRPRRDRPRLPAPRLCVRHLADGCGSRRRRGVAVPMWRSQCGRAACVGRRRSRLAADRRHRDRRHRDRRLRGDRGFVRDEVAACVRRQWRAHPRGGGEVGRARLPRRSVADRRVVGARCRRGVTPRVRIPLLSRVWVVSESGVGTSVALPARGALTSDCGSSVRRFWCGLRKPRLLNKLMNSVAQRREVARVTRCDDRDLVVVFPRARMCA